MKPVLNNQYALLVPDQQGNSFGAVYTWLTAKGKTLADALSPADLQKAASSPCWVRVNMQTVYGLVSPLLKQSQTAEPDKASQPQMDPANKPVSPQSALTGNPFAQLWSKSPAPAQQADALLQQLDSVVLSLSVQPDLLSVESALVPKAGSELEGVFTRKTPMTSRFTMGGYLDPQAQINGLMNMNKPMWIRVNEIVLNIFASMGQEGNSAELMTKFKSLMNKSMTAVGSEAAFSFGYGAGTLPFTMREVVEISDEKAFREMLQESTGLVTELYTAMGIPATFRLQQGKENYKGISIDQANIQFAFPEGTDPQANAAMEALYGKDGLTYPFAVSKNRMLMTMGPAADAELKKLIDMQIAVPPMPSEMQTAMKLIPQSDSADMILSLNVIRLMKGMSEMMAEMAKKTSPEGTPVPPFAQMLEGIPMNTQSSMAVGTHIDQGRIQTRIALPKQHLMEITTVAMQIQQKVMMQQMQQQQLQQGQPAAPAETSPSAPVSNP
jgi:hypothetical protein